MEIDYGGQMILEEAKLAMRLVNTAYDNEILRLLNLGNADLGIPGINKVTPPITATTVVDDALISGALITFCRLNFGSPSDVEYQRLKLAYDEQKAQLISCSGYGLPVVTV